jgi:hypothetical protein
MDLGKQKIGITDLDMTQLRKSVAHQSEQTNSFLLMKSLVKWSILRQSTLENVSTTEKAA